MKAVTTFAIDELSSVVGLHAGAKTLRPRSFDLTDAVGVVHSYVPMPRRIGPPDSLPNFHPFTGLQNLRDGSNPHKGLASHIRRWTKA